LPGCQFADELHGHWRTFDDVIDRSHDFRSTRDLDIDGDRVEAALSQGGGRAMSKMRWVCKNRHWQRPYYQVLLLRNNGW